MKCSDIIALLEKEYPVEKAEEWDNPGLLVGRADREVKKVIVALDATDEVIGLAVREKAQMLFTHHPMIFGAVKKINDGDFLGRKILTLIENGISYYAAHTNYDVCRMADLNEEQIGLTDTEVLLVTGTAPVSAAGTMIPEGIGRVGNLKTPVSLKELALRVKTAMDVESVRLFGPGEKIVSRAAVSGGSGKSVIKDALDAKAEVLITGDIDHHAGLDALDCGLCIIDAGHYGTEHCFIADAAARLRTLAPELEVIEADQKEPFMVL